MTVRLTTHETNGFTWQRMHISRVDRLNALGTSIAGELTESLDLLRRRPKVACRAIVITAETVVKGDRSFWIAGGDLKELSELKTKVEGRAYAKAMRLFCEGLDYLPVPVITVIDGAAIGGGAELALCGDIRLATVRSSFEFKQLVVGLATGYGASSRLIDLIGKSKTQELLYFCESIQAEDAHVLGLVHRLIPSASVEDIGNHIFPILKLEPVAVAAQKKMLRMASNQKSSDHTWSDQIFESIWMNETHEKTLSEFANR